jgi:hypothetical protein
MQSHNYPASRYYLQRYLYPYQYVINEGWTTSSLGNYFNVTGFVTPSGRKFVDATDGEYHKQVWRNLYGQADYRTIGYSGETTGHTDFNGDFGVIGRGSRLITSAFIAEHGSYDNNRYQRALEKLYDGVRLSESNLALSIGEARESGRMLKVGKSVYEVLTLARRAKRDFLRNPSKKLSEIWLSYKYGWQPLMTDVYNYLNWSYTSFNEGVPVVGRSRVRSAIAVTDGVVNSSTGRSFITGSKEHKCEVKCWIGLGDTDAYNLSRITSLNPLSIAWELVPLSFVADWFYDVGGYLQLMEASLGAGVTFKRGYVTEVAYYDASERLIQDFSEGSPPYVFRTTASAEAKWIVARKRRVRLYALPFPRAPTLNLKLGWQRITSAGALIRTILLGKVR